MSTLVWFLPFGKFVCYTLVWMTACKFAFRQRPPEMGSSRRMALNALITLADLYWVGMMATQIIMSRDSFGAVMLAQTCLGLLGLGIYMVHRGLRRFYNIWHGVRDCAVSLLTGVVGIGFYDIAYRLAFIGFPNAPEAAASIFVVAAVATTISALYCIRHDPSQLRRTTR